MHILLVEEDAQDYLTIRQFLDEQSGKSKIDWAPNYESALKSSKSKNYDVFLIGYYARHSKQEAFLRWLYRFAKVPVILLLKTEDDTQHLDLSAYKTDYLLKRQLSWSLLHRVIRYINQLIEIDKSCQHYRFAFKQAVQFIGIFSPQGKVLEANQTALGSIDSSLEQVQNQYVWDTAWAKNNQAQFKSAVATAAHGEFIHYEMELETDQRGNIIIDFSLTPIKNDMGKVLWLLAEGRDLSERKDMEQQLTHATLHDHLTGLPNRQLFFEYLERAMQKLSHSHKRLAVLFIDIDRFRMVNESLGHDMGDWLLMEIAERLQSSIAPDNLLARFGGDEFAIIQEDVEDLADATRLAAKINKALAQPFLLDGCEVVTSASIGIAYNHDEIGDGANLLRNADTAMYRAKMMGKSRYAVYNQSMESNALSRLKIEAELHRGLERDDFILFYQPQLDLGSEQICGVEALIRFNHPHKGLMSPVEFIPILEDSGIIVKLSEWILHTACTQFKTWLAQGFPMQRIAVNLSALQFKSHNLTHLVAKVLHDTHLDAQHLELELTEHSLLEDTHTAIKTINRFKDMGIRVTIDDFGTGYASLNYLKHFPAHCLKIDKSFIQEITHSKIDAEITKAMINMAHALGMSVIAEGVETIQQRDFLRRNHCDSGQGYLYAPAMSQQDFMTWAHQYCKMQDHAI
ncbi:EAL domain-containing protein [Candidatus Albibeggiatoa sp. nov. NOAA]|uniref:GGDEF/EAL-containing response regulator n=1 Tax=Candidatus Albibeggiatoa sp. nov. NOAA TaxID=3162724 RepID=UPI0032FB55A8|nr:EAL domain-containing protein [Thiotrichaceae bacterium]